MVRGKRGQATCNTSSSKKTHGCQLLWAATIPKVGWAVPAYHRKVHSSILERGSIACRMRGLMSALGCELGHGI